jgi:3-dehydroquinate synthase
MSGECRLLHGPGSWDELGRSLLAARRGTKVTVVTDANVLRAHSDDLEERMRRAGLDPSWIVVEVGEKSRSMERVLWLLDQLRRRQHPTWTTLLAVGGGVVLDLVGFTASLLGHGTNWSAVPTSLTAQANPPINGRVGVTLKGVDKLLGVTHAPRAVLLDDGLLQSLPKRQMQSGFGVVLQRTAARDRALFRYVAERSELLLARDSETLNYVIQRSAALTPGRLGPEVLEPGAAMASLVRRLDRSRNHGEAAAIGLAFTLELSMAIGALDAEDAEEIRTALKAFHLPSNPAPFLGGDAPALLDWGRPPHKNRVPIVVLERLGQAKLASVHVNDLLDLTTRLVRGER